MDMLKELQKHLPEFRYARFVKVNNLLTLINNLLTLINNLLILINNLLILINNVLTLTIDS